MASRYDDKVEYRHWQEDESDYRVVCTDGDDGSQIHVAIEGCRPKDMKERGLTEDDVLGISFMIRRKDDETDWVCLDEKTAQTLFETLARAYADRERDGRGPSA